MWKICLLIYNPVVFWYANAAFAIFAPHLRFSFAHFCDIFARIYNGFWTCKLNVSFVTAPYLQGSEVAFGGAQASEKLVNPLREPSGDMVPR